jgi:rhomboid protease GluP
VVAVGASGAIFGLYGIIMAFITLKIFDASVNRFLLTLLACTAGYSLLMGFLSDGIDNSAHLCGLVAVFIMGIFFAKPLKSLHQ